MNPTQSIEEIEMPQLSRVQPAILNGRLFFTDAGFKLVLNAPYKSADLDAKREWLTAVIAKVYTDRPKRLEWLPC